MAPEDRNDLDNERDDRELDAAIGVAEDLVGAVDGVAMNLEEVLNADSDADLSDVKPDVRLRDQLDLDSMDFLDIVMELRKRFKVENPKRFRDLDRAQEKLAEHRMTE